MSSKSDTQTLRSEEPPLWRRFARRIRRAVVPDGIENSAAPESIRLEAEVPAGFDWRWYVGSYTDLDPPESTTRRPPSVTGSSTAVAKGEGSRREGRTASTGLRMSTGFRRVPRLCGCRLRDDRVWRARQSTASFSARGVISSAGMTPEVITSCKSGIPRVTMQPSFSTAPISTSAASVQQAEWHGQNSVHDVSSSACSRRTPAGGTGVLFVS